MTINILYVLQPKFIKFSNNQQFIYNNDGIEEIFVCKNYKKVPINKEIEKDHLIFLKIMDYMLDDQVGSYYA